MTEAQIKAAVRARDGHRCTVCGMTSAEHVAKYGRDLDVHRVTPGAIYAADSSCQTMCRSCHGPQPRSVRYCSGVLRVRLDKELAKKLRTLAAILETSPSSIVAELVAEFIPGRFAEIFGKAE